MLQKRTGEFCTGDITAEEPFFNHLDWPTMVNFLDGACVPHIEDGLWMKFARPWRTAKDELLFPNCSLFAGGGPAGRVAAGTYVLQLYTNPICQIESVAGFESATGASTFHWEETTRGCFKFTDQTERSEDLLNSDGWREGVLDSESFKLVCDSTSSGFTVQQFADDTCSGQPVREDTFFWETCYPDMLSLFHGGECVQVGSAFSSWWSSGYLRFDKAWPEGTLDDCTGPNQVIPECPGDVEQRSIQVNYDSNGRYTGRVSSSHSSRLCSSVHGPLAAMVVEVVLLLFWMF